MYGDVRSRVGRGQGVRSWAAGAGLVLWVMGARAVGVADGFVDVSLPESVFVCGCAVLFGIGWMAGK